MYLPLKKLQKYVTIPLGVWKMKKPFYKRWWFWAVVAFVVIGAIGSALEKGEAPVQATAPAQESSELPEPATEQTAGPTQTPVPTPTPTPTPAPTQTPEPTSTPEPLPEQTPAAVTTTPTASGSGQAEVQGPSGSGGEGTGGGWDSEPSGTQPVPTDAPSGMMVWIPQSGSKYHSSPNCSNMKNPTQVTVSQAEAWGYEPCKKCFG